MISATVAERLMERGIEAAAIDGNRALVALPDIDVFAMAQRERRSVVTENVRHYRPLAAQAVDAGDGHCGVLYVASSRHGIGALLDLLERAAAQHPGDDDLRNREVWL